MWLLEILIPLLILAAIVAFLWRVILGGSRRAFLKLLPSEATKWVTQGIIGAEQQNKILALYAPKAGEMKNRAPAILISMACVLLAVGIVLFYAANWATMSPMFKLIQVFALVVLLYSLSFYFINKPDTEMIGRAFLVLGMISFGVGIVLVAQIYHIMAEGGTGLLVWSVGTMLMSWVMRERWGCYLAAGLLIIWTGEIFVSYQEANYLFPLLALPLFWLFYQLQARVGLALMIVELVLWFFQVNLAWMETLPRVQMTEQSLLRAFLFLHLPLGVIIVAAGRLCEKIEVMSLASKVMNLGGWLLVFTPLIGLSWPLGSLDAEHQFLWRIKDLAFLNSQYFGFMVIAAMLVSWLYQRKQNFELPAIAMAIGLCYLLPLGSNTTLMVATHLALLAYFGSLLFFSYQVASPQPIEKFAAFAIAIATLVVKGIVFLGYGAHYYQFYVAYILGFVIFATVCFLINQFVGLNLNTLGKPYPTALINRVCSALAFLLVYAMSFHLPVQTAISSADPVVLTMVWLFVAIALCLYAILALRNNDRLLLGLSAITFVISVAVLFYAGPDVSWLFYSITFNILLFVLEGTAIYYGVTINSAMLVNVALGAFVVHVISRYFDLLFDMLSGSALFIATGLLLLGGGYLLEKNRRKLLEKIDHEKQDSTKGVGA